MKTPNKSLSRTLMRGILFAAVLCLLFAGPVGADPYLNIEVTSAVLTEYPASAVFTFSSAGCTDLKVNYGDGTAEVSISEASKVLSHEYKNPGTYTVWLNATSGGTQYSTSKQIVVKPYPANGAITIQSPVDVCHLLDSFTVSGQNTYTNSVRVYIKGNNFDFMEITSEPISVSDDGWSFEVNLTTISQTNAHGFTRYLDAGTYNFYAVVGDETVSFAELAESKYDDVSIRFVLPTISVTPSSNRVTAGTDIILTGRAYGAETVKYYLFGENKIITGTAPVDAQDKISITVPTTGFESGIYSAVVQHPMYGGEFNIYSEARDSYYDFYLKIRGSSEEPELLFSTENYDSLLFAGNALIESLTSQNIDDRYSEAVFVVTSSGDDREFVAITDMDISEVSSELSFSGLNSANNYVHLYLKSSSGAVTRLTRTPISSENSHWETTVDLPIFRKLGTYAFYAVASSSQTPPAVSEIEDGTYAIWELENTLTASVKAEGVENSHNYVNKNKEASISGTAKDTLLVQYYIVGTNYCTVGTVLTNSNGEFTIPLPTSSMHVGPYYAVIQHPGDDGLFNLGPVENDDGGYTICLNTAGSYDVPGHIELFETQLRQTANVAQALCDLLRDSNIDDTHTFLSFEVVREDFDIVDQDTPTTPAIPSPLKKGMDVGLGGTSKEDFGKTVSLILQSTDDPTQSFSDSTIIADDGTWHLSISTDNIPLGTYNLKVICEGNVWEEMTLTIVDKYRVTSYTIPLRAGWNFISIPKYLDSSCDTAGELFGSLNTDGMSHLGYDAKTGWYVLKADTQLKPLDGYWVYSKEAANLPLTYSQEINVPAVKAVYKGWNAVGLSAETSLPAGFVFSNLDWVRCLSWDLEEGKWGTVIAKNVQVHNSEETPVTLGNGNWLYVETDGTYLGNTA